MITKNICFNKGKMDTSLNNIKSKGIFTYICIYIGLVTPRRESVYRMLLILQLLGMCMGPTELILQDVKRCQESYHLA